MKSLLLILLAAISSNAAHAIEVSEPKVNTFESVEFSSKDDHVKTLDKVEFIIDPFAARDDLLELKARNQHLKSEKGTAFNVYGYHEDAGVFIAAHHPVSHISVIGKENGNVLAIFYDRDNRVIAPPKESFQLLDFNFNKIDFDYTPALPPSGITMDVSILIDVSGSMKSVLYDVSDASIEFMSNLPDFTRCSVLTFGSKIEYLSETETDKLKSCPDSVDVLKNGLRSNGATALHLAIKQSMEAKAATKNSFPNLQVVLTDGADTQNPEITPEQLEELKTRSNSKLLFFWAGYYNDHLKSIADIETVSGSNIKSDLDAFFRSLGISINGMQSLTVK